MKVDLSHLHQEKGDVIIEGKTKIVYELPKHPGRCLIKSKVRCYTSNLYFAIVYLIFYQDSITAYNGEMKNTLEGKAEMSTSTTSAIFTILQHSNIKTSLIQKVRIFE